MIGTTNGTEVGETTTNISTVNIIRQQSGYLPNGVLYNRPELDFSQNISVIPNSVISFSQDTFAHVFVYDSEDNYLGQYQTRSLPYWGDSLIETITNNQITVPENTAYVILFSSNTANSTMGFGNWPYYTSTANFSNVVLTITSTIDNTYLQIDPPTGKRIKQIALKGL